MSASGQQTFHGTSHRIRFLFQPPRGPIDRLLVCFADAGDEPRLQFVEELSGVDAARLHVLDDFGPYAGEFGFPGSWYLGESRRLTVTDDVARLVDHAARTLGLDRSQITAVGTGAGGFAALHLAGREGWADAIVGFPHVRLGRHLVGDLDEVASFIAGGISPSDRHWLNELLLTALARSAGLPRIELVSGGANLGQHALPLLDAVRAREGKIELTRVDAPADPAAQARAFLPHLLAAIARRGGLEQWRVEFGDGSAHRSRWNTRGAARVERVEDGVRCFAPPIGLQEGGVYGGLRFAVGSAAQLRVELTLRRVHDVEALLVDAGSGDDRRLARWIWRFDQRAPTPGRTVLILDASGVPPTTAELTGDLAEAAWLDVFVRIRPQGAADFTVHAVDVVRSPEEAAPPPGLPLPVATDIAAGLRRLRDHAAVARQVAALVAEGAFPPAAILPDRPPRRPGLKVACLLDRFSELGFRYEFDYVDFTPDDFRAVIDREKPDLLLVESIWRGKNETWDKLMVPDVSGRGPTEPVRELVAHCRAAGIPTVFWNKEDPPNFEHFVQTAKLFDFIFTTDESCVPRYQAVTSHATVGVLPFAAQPAIHNPIGSPVQRPLDLAFLGTFYGRKHAARKRQMEMILDPAREFGVHIYSRVEASGGYAFPEKYVPHLIGTIPYENVLGAYRTYKVLLNVNSVPDSRTMCARRVFEILACGGTVVSGPAPALEAVLGPGVVHESGGYGQTREILAQVLSNESLRDRAAIAGIRRILRGHTYSDRVDHVLAAVGMGGRVSRSTVGVVAVVSSDEEARWVVEMALAQSRTPDEILLVHPNGAIEESRHQAAAAPHEIVLHAVAGEGELTPLAGLDLAARRCECDLLAVIDPVRATYGPHYLEDLIGAQVQSDADIVGKGAYYRHDADRGWLVVERREDENRYVDSVHPASLLVRRRVADGAAEQHADAVEWQRRAAAGGATVYAANRFNFAVTGTSAGEAGGFVEIFGAGAEHALA